MTRSSRHKSHGGHKSRDMSDSEEEGSGRGRKARDESAGSRVPREADGIGFYGGDEFGESGKKKKDMTVKVTAVADRWKGDVEDGHEDQKELKCGNFGRIGEEDVAIVRPLVSDSKSKSSGRFVERKDERGSFEEPKKRRFQKESGWQESICQYTDVKERDEDHLPNKEKERPSRRSMGFELEKERKQGFENDWERSSERSREYDREIELTRDKEWVAEIERERDRGKFSDARQERSRQTLNRYPRTSVIEDEDSVKVDIENTDSNVHDGVCKSSLEKEQEKWVRSDDIDHKDGRLTNSNATYDRRSSYPDDRGRSGSYKDERYQHVKLRENCQEDLSRNHNLHDEKLRDTRTSRCFTDDRSDRQYENHYRSSFQQSEHGVEYIVDNKDSKGRKMTSDEKDDNNFSKRRDFKLSRTVVGQNTLNDQPNFFNEDRVKPESIHSKNIDVSPSRIQSKSSLSHKDESRHCSSQLQTDSARRSSLSKKRYHTSSASSADIANTSEATERVIKSHSMDNRLKMKDTVRGDFLDDATGLLPKYDPRACPNDKSVSIARQYASRKSVRHDCYTVEIGQRKDGREYQTNEEKLQDTIVGKQFADEKVQPDLLNNGPSRSGSFSHGRSDNFLLTSPCHLPPPPPLRHAVDNPSILGSFDENRIQSADRKFNNRYRRAGDPNNGRGPSNAWKGVPNWLSPVANGFIPFQHGPPPARFHRIVQHFPPSMFGVRPFMDGNHTTAPFHMLEAHDRLSSQGHPFGWQNPSNDSCPPHLQVWNGSSVGFGDDSQMHGRQDRETSRHLINNQVWDMAGDTWKGQIGRHIGEFPASQTESDVVARGLLDETQTMQSSHQRGHGLWPQKTEPNLLKDEKSINTLERDTESPLKIRQDKAPSPAPLSKADGASFCRTFLSILDISLELTQQELFKRCSDVSGTVGDAILQAGSAVREEAQCTRENISLIVGSTKARVSIFPQITDGIFKRAIALYRRRDVGGEDKKTSSILLSEENLFSKVLKEEKAKSVSTFPSAEDNPLADTGDHINIVEENGSSKFGFPIFENNAERYLSDKIPSGADFADVSYQKCEGLLPDCLNRIHHSPESTH